MALVAVTYLALVGRMIKIRETKIYSYTKSNIKNAFKNGNKISITGFMILFVTCMPCKIVLHSSNGQLGGCSPFPQNAMQSMWNQIYHILLDILLVKKILPHFR